MVWIVTVTRYGWGPMETRTVGVAATEKAARGVVTEHGVAVGCYLDDWALVERDGEVVSVGLEGDDCEVTATRWKVST
tara:strand:+ start:87 stop:320 length:234 start_codon:yes stop_codon:yes gene_type:complete